MGDTRSDIAWKSLLLCAALAISQGACRAQGDSDLREVTVAQLAEIVHGAKDKRDGDIAKVIERVELTERLSSLKLAVLRGELPGTKSRKALMAVGDSSVFLEPPKSEIPGEPVPDVTKRTQILARAVDYLGKIIPRLPDFYAKRFTTSFEVFQKPKDQKGGNKPEPLHAVGEFKATVYFRSGKEVVRADGAQERALVTRGTFGPILATVFMDASRGKVHWSRWEEGPSGPMTVFRVVVPKSESHYESSFWSASPMGGVIGATGPTAYHGEIGIDPDTGTILRLVLEADPDLGSPMERADIMVEYGPVVIGGKVYTCPTRSVSILTGESVQGGIAMRPRALSKTTRLNDVVFSDYHVFRTVMRIVP